MSLLEEIRRDLPEAAKDLEKAGFTSDSDIGSLDRTDLWELLPGVQNLKKRHDLFHKIHRESAGSNSRTGPEVLKEIEGFYSEATSVLKQKDCYKYLEVVVRPDLLELFPEVEKLEWRRKIFEIVHPKSSAVGSQSSASGTNKFINIFKGLTQREGLPIIKSKEVRYQILDSGKCPKISQKVIQKVTSKIGVFFRETKEDHEVSILFCPVISRIGSDAEAAIASIKDDKPVILVFLIHSLKPHSISSLNCWDDSINILRHVHIFHHETKSGLLRCEENNVAISDIKEILLKYSEEIKQDQGGIASGKGS